MASLSTEDFPYTLDYLTEFLQVNEGELMAFVQALSMTPQHDEQTGGIIFSHRDLEIIRKAIEMKRSGESLTVIVERLGRKMPQSQQSKEPQQTSRATSPMANVNLPQSPAAAASSMPAGMTKSAGKDNLSVIIEAVSQAKEGILKDLARLLDDKLAGLDEVVVELIRCKSENDALKQKLKTAVQEKEAQEYELSRFKPVQFGFYRKV